MMDQPLLMKARAGRVTALSHLIRHRRTNNAKALSNTVSGRRFNQDTDIVDRLFSNLEFTFNTGQSA
ncbi:hypothetical protein L0666_11860 [Octadecabacter sp. CECT 8868]|uniref:hypothetical protein n=1 Tax=Octadecabacter algicola TaxID=2909342 RepID=UPI001F45ABAC|nr:hypothetical protein [Octadecabacter algicola]MCF2905684.1 hypothetical protein [Octadecabacter algicola]